MLFTFSALIIIIYWCGIVSHQQILMVRHVAPAKIIGAANAVPAAPVSTPMTYICFMCVVYSPNESYLIQPEFVRYSCTGTRQFIDKTIHRHGF